MAADLANYNERAKEAVQIFWQTREAATLKQRESGTVLVAALEFKSQVGPSFGNVSNLTSLKSFAAALAGHIATIAARK